MSRYAVTANFKGEHVYIGEHAYPRQVLLTLNFEPVIYTDLIEAQRIEAAAEKDETLYDVPIEVV